MADPAPFPSAADLRQAYFDLILTRLSAADAFEAAAEQARLGGSRHERPRAALEYCVLRVVPDIERGEFLNIGVVLICRQSRYLDARIHLDHDRLRSLWPQISAETIDLIEQHLALIPLICAGDDTGGPIARLGLGERWHWLTAPASTIVQPGPMHTGLADDPGAELDRLFTRLVQRGGVDADAIECMQRTGPVLAGGTPRLVCHRGCSRTGPICSL